MATTAANPEAKDRISSCRGLALTLAILAIGVLPACGGGSDDRQSPGVAARIQSATVAGASSENLSTLSVANLVLKAERRISRTVFEYDYQVEITNQGATATGVIAKLTAAGPGTTIVDGSVNAGTVAAGASVTPSDIIQLRHDRTLPFQLAALVWQVTGEPLPLVTSIPGAPTDPAVNNIPEYVSEQSFPANEFEFDLARGGTVLRSKVIIGLQEGTTVSQVNALLLSMSASIVRTYANTGVVEFRIADPGSMAQLNTVLTTLRMNPIVAFAIPTSFAPTNELPTILRSVPSETERLFHHLAIKAPAAWNARAAISSTADPSGPVLLVADYFGGGAPASNLFGAAGVSGYGSGFTTTSPWAHGYHVLSIAAASFNGPQNSADSSSISGLYAANRALELDIEDLAALGSAPCQSSNSKICYGETLESRLRALLSKHTAAKKNVVLNTSLGFNGNGGISEAEAEGLKKYWLKLLQGKPGVPPVDVNRFLHAASAGNAHGLLASWNIGWTRAGLDGSLTNTAVVENRMASPLAPFSAGFPASSSSLGGNLSAIGSSTSASLTTPEGGIFGYIDARGTSADRSPCPAPNQTLMCAMSGTSMAAPQVAGLAAYVWALKPKLTSTELLSLITSNAVAFNDGGQPLIDAYAAVLATDDTEALAGAMGNRLKAPVRLAILDVDGDGLFTLDDALLFASAFVSNPGQTAYNARELSVAGTKTVDISRFDLNGDGLIGGSGTSRFNLNINYEPGTRKSKYDKVDYLANGTSVTIDESAATDLEVLCYYIHSPLFDASKGSLDEVATRLTAAGLSCSAKKTSLLGAKLTFSRRYPTIDTPYDYWIPSSASTVVSTGPADAITWPGISASAVIDPEADTISWVLPRPSEYVGFSDGFDGFVVVGIPADLASASVESSNGIAVAVTLTGARQLNVNMNGKYLAGASFKIRLTFK